MERELRDLRAQEEFRRNLAHGGRRPTDPIAHAAPPPPRSPLDDEALSFRQWISAKIAAEPYWFHRIRLPGGLETPGWSDPATDKLPYFGLPADLSGLRVLDIGCAEGFFSFEAERRGAREVVAIDSLADSVRRFNLCAAALGSRATAHLASVYTLSPETMGTFDMVLFFGVLYHLKHPWLALERIRSVTSGTLLFQSLVEDEPKLQSPALARFHPHGIMSGPNREHWDPTVFWVPNPRACIDLLSATGFVNVQIVSQAPFVARALSPLQSGGQAPDHTRAPWS